MATLNRDLIANAPVRDVANGTMALLDRAQNMPPAILMASSAAMFLLLSERMGMPAQDVFTFTKNIMNHAADNTRRVEFDAVAAYLENEL